MGDNFVAFGDPYTANLRFFFRCTVEGDRRQEGLLIEFFRHPDLRQYIHRVDDRKGNLIRLEITDAEKYLEVKRKYKNLHRFKIDGLLKQ